jgi:hypothetical protein
MIMGLAPAERTELLANVSRQMERESAMGARTPQEVFEFQTGQTVQSSQEPQTSSKETRKKQPKVAKVAGAGTKITKHKGKFQKAKLELARAHDLIQLTNRLLTTRDENLSSETTATTSRTDSSVYHALEELQTMSRPELKMQRLKYLAQKAECEQKIAKSRAKLYQQSRRPLQ